MQPPVCRLCRDFGVDLTDWREGNTACLPAKDSRTVRKLKKHIMLLHHCQFKHFSYERIKKWHPLLPSYFYFHLAVLDPWTHGSMDPPVEKTRRPNGLVPICSFDWISFCCHDSAVMGWWLTKPEGRYPCGGDDFQYENGGWCRKKRNFWDLIIWNHFGIYFLYLNVQSCYCIETKKG